MADVHIYRVQDREGRGPYRPGFTRKWADQIGANVLPTFVQEFGSPLLDEINSWFAVKGGHFGCGCDDLDTLARWFSQAERLRLAKHRYAVARVRVDRILARSPNQIVFWRKSPMTDGAFFLPWSALP